MKQFVFLREEEVFPGSDIARKYSFKTMGTRDSYALLARENHNLAMDFAFPGEKSALFQEDCFECLSPHKTAA